jgi:hypothetical protein
MTGKKISLLIVALAVGALINLQTQFAMARPGGSHGGGAIQWWWSTFQRRCARMAPRAQEHRVARTCRNVSTRWGPHGLVALTGAANISARSGKSQAGTARANAGCNISGAV